MLRVDSYDGLHSSYLSTDLDQSETSDSSSLNSSVLERNITLSHPVYIHADSLESLDDMLAESGAAEIMAFKNTSALCDDLRFISGMSEMCDVKFFVGEEKAVVYGVKAILATRSRVFYEMIISAQKNRQELLKAAKPKQSKGQKVLSKLLKWTGRKSRSRSSQAGQRSQWTHININIHDFSPDTFRRVVLYLHCGSTSVNIQSVVGVMNAAAVYGVEDLRAACFEFAQRFLNVKTVLKLLILTEMHSHHRWTKILVAKIFEFIERNGAGILKHQDFGTLPEETAKLILSRPKLRASEEDKWDAALRWSRRHSDHRSSVIFQNALSIFVPFINFVEIPLAKLRSEIRPLDVVPEDVINRAIIQQASARFVIGQEKRSSTNKKPSHKRRERRSVDSITWARSYIQRKASTNSTVSDSFRPGSYDSGFISSDDGYMV